MRIKSMKNLLSIILFILVIPASINAQNVKEITTEYSQTEGGSIGKEKCYFHLTNGRMMKSVVVNGIGTMSGYGPLKLEKTSYDQRGMYVVEYIPNVTAQNWRSFQNNMKSYRYFYDRNGGNVMMIAEIIIHSNRSHSIKRYYTEAGYNQIISATKSSSSSYELKENNFDVNDVVVNSTTLNQIMSKINFSFEQYGNKKTSDDGNYVSVTYKNSSLITPIITYTKSGNVTQIVLLMPIVNADYIVKELIKRFGTQYIDGEEVVRRGELTYDYRVDGEVGIVVIY